MREPRVCETQRPPLWQMLWPARKRAYQISFEMNQQPRLAGVGRVTATTRSSIFDSRFKHGVEIPGRKRGARVASAWRVRGSVGHGVWRAIVHKEARGFFTIEWAGAAAAEDGDLIAAFIHSAVAVNALRYCERGTAGAIGGDQFGRGAGAEAVRIGRIFRRQNLQHAQTIAAVRDEREGAGVHHADLDVLRVVDLSVAGEHLIELRLLWFLNIHDGDAFPSACDVSVRARDVDIARVGERHDGARKHAGMVERRNVENF